MALVQVVLHVIQEFSYTDLIILQKLDDVHALAVLLFLRHVGVVLKEFCDRDVVFLQELDECHVDVAPLLVFL